MGRGEFLKASGAGLAGAALLGSSVMAGCGSGGGEEGDAGEIVFSFFPDPTGSIRGLVDRYNGENREGPRVVLREMPADSGQHFDELNTGFQSGQSNIDVIGGDVIWPAQFAAAGYIADLSERFPQSEREAYLPAAIQANTYEGKIYGVPFYVDAGMLYYRKDLLEDAGVSEPPRTWDELKEVAERVRRDADVPYGFVFQGANYEGGVVNALEYIWTSGGDVLDGEKVVIDSPEAERGLTIERSMISDRLAPKGVTQFKEQESATVFLRGDAVFMRNVPRMYALASDPAESRIDPGQIGISTLPVAEEGLQSYSSLGGWNFFLNASSKNPDAAYRFIEYMSAEPQQKRRAIEGSVIPSRTALYEDGELLEKVPVVRLGRKAVENTRPRPVSPFYSDMSLAMGDQFTASLNGRISPGEALSTLKEDLSKIIKQGKQQTS